jgi:inward rectifier potassium channel
MAAPEPYDIKVINAPRASAADLYHLLLVAPWWADLLLIVGTFLVSNLGFAAAFFELGGVANAKSLSDDFFFSVQTMGTIGYGVMYPQTPAANGLVVAEAIFGLVLVALSTGLVFAKFSVPRGRMRFAGKLCVAPVDGVPCMMLRAGNQRSNRIVEARIRLSMVRTEKTGEGVVFYRMYDVPLVRDMTPLFARSWTVMHRIDEKSLLFGYTPERLQQEEVEFVVTLTGLDETSGQMVHGRFNYQSGDIVFGSRHADMLSDISATMMQLDVSQFDMLVPTVRTESFPYP